MSHKVLLPQLGISEESAVLTVWLVKQGDAVKRGQKLFSLETGKSTFDVESEAEGTVLALLVSEGDEVPVKTPVCIIGEITDNNEQRTMNNEQITDNSEQTAEDRVLIPEKEPPLQIVNCSLSTVNCPPPPSSPRAKKLAEKNDTDPSLAVPTGPHGRIIERDVRQLVENSEPLTANTPAPPVIEKAAAPPTAAYQDNVLPTIRKTIAKTMTASLRSAAQLTHTASFDAANILEYRKLLKNTPGYAGVTLTDMILYAVTRTLPAFPALNAWLTEGDVLRTFNDVSLACAVDTERGLMVPVIRGASDKSLLELSRELKALAEGCRNGTVNPDLLTGGSFTVSNLGQYGIESFTPILNPPQTGILGVCGITQRVRVTDGQLTAYPAMPLSLTYDHRALDGAPASKFLQTLCKNLETFTTLLAG